MSHPAARSGRPLPNRRESAQQIPGASVAEASPPSFDFLLSFDRAAIALRAASERLAEPLARVARAFVARNAWGEFGHARLEDHARERFRRSARWLRDLAFLGESLEASPCLAAALTGDDGAEPIGRVAALAIARVTDRHPIEGLIALARTVPVRELREKIKQMRNGDVCQVGESPSAIASSYETCMGDEDSESERVLVSFTAPAAVKAAFEEGLLLHRAVSGREETVASFVDALVAESFAGPHPPDAFGAPLRAGVHLSHAEAAMARATGNWGALASNQGSGKGSSEEGMARVGSTLEEIEIVSAKAGIGDAADLDAQMRTLLDLEDRIDRELGRLLVEMSARGAWARLFFSGTGHYAEERLGLGRTTAEARAQMARMLRRYPVLRRAYEDGRVGLEAGLIVMRILGRHGGDKRLEHAWVERASEATVRRLRDEARMLGFMKATEGVGLESAGPRSDAEWHASLRRKSGDFNARVDRLGRLAAASPFAGEFMRLRLPEETANGFLSAIESMRCALASRVEETPWHEAWPDIHASGSVLAARTFSIRCRRVPSWVGFLALLEDYMRTWDAAGGSTNKRKAEPTYIRDGWRCMAPGCTSRQNLEEHHVVYRSRGGGNDTSNLVCLCRFHHHLGEHAGFARCRGPAPLGIEWILGTGGIGGRYRNDRRILVSRSFTQPVPALPTSAASSC